ncbi:hypothetical protein AX16_000355 [Volvariella volvacea WC 439]|nr:hypothetical protein AX16_000355 [Volvariella volvacea WC 439]
MLISMSFHLGLLFVITTALGFAQFFIELHKTKAHSEYENLSHHPIDSPRTPLVQENPYALRTVTSNISGTRPRSRSKPDAIFIHPNDSNIARADAAALELGIGGDTEYVKGDVYTHEPARWETGAGRDMARALLGSGRQKRDTGFTIGDDSDSDESD